VIFLFQVCDFYSILIYYTFTTGLRRDLLGICILTDLSENYFYQLIMVSLLIPKQCILDMKLLLSFTYIFLMKISSLK